MTNPTDYPEILRLFPEANFLMPPLSSEEWALAIEETIQESTHSELCKFVRGFPIATYKYEQLTRAAIAETQLEANKSTDSRATISTALDSFVHANYSAITKDFTGLLVIEGELIAESGGHKDIASAKRKYQAYLGHYKAGFKNGEQLKELLAKKAIKEGDI